MKKPFLILLISCYAVTAVAQTPTKISAAFYAKYPERPSNFCQGCTIDSNIYFTTITDNNNGYSKVSYAYYTPEREQKVKALSVDRGTYGVWHSYPGQVNENHYYTNINKGITSSTAKYAKGHYIAFELCAYSIEGAVVSCTYMVNEGVEYQGQNQGSELDVENLTRLLVGSTSTEVAKVKHKMQQSDFAKYGIGPVYQRVDFWKGGWVDSTKQPKIVSDGHISRVMTNIYWNLLKYGDQVHAFWFPNDQSGSASFVNFEIPYTELVARLGYDPSKVIVPH